MTRTAHSLISPAKLNGFDIQLLDQHEEASLVNRIGIAQNFFYDIQQHDTKNYSEHRVILSERGIGEIYKEGDNYFLKRERPITFYDGTYTSPSRPSVFCFFNPAHPTGTVESYIPENYSHTLFSPYSVLCSIEAHTPSPVELEENTLLGRKDGRIQSIDKDELRSILTDNHVIAAMSEATTPLNVKTPTLNLRRKNSLVSTHVLHVKPVYGDSDKPPKPQRGSLIFNDTHGYFEGYDGNEWRPLLWGQPE